MRHGSSIFLRNANYSRIIRQGFDTLSCDCFTLFYSLNRMLYVSEMAALEKVNVPGDLVETFERVSLAAKIFHSVSGEMLLLRHN